MRRLSKNDMGLQIPALDTQIKIFDSNAIATERNIKISDPIQLRLSGQLIFVLNRII